MSLSPQDLPSLAEYARTRDALRAEIMALKTLRRVFLGDSLMLLFENRRTIFYQIMEVLRIEKRENDAAKFEELEAYAPLIPDGSEFKATMQLEFEEVEVRDAQLIDLRGIEHRIHCRVGDGEPITAIADEDMERSDEHKTAAVHFLRWPLDSEQLAALGGGAALRFGCDHPRYRHESEPLSDAVRGCLIGDLHLPT